MHERLLAGWRVAALALWTGALLLPALLTYALIGRTPRRLARLWNRSCCAIAGLRLRVVGVPATGRPTLFVANHIS